MISYMRAAALASRMEEIVAGSPYDLRNYPQVQDGDGAAGALVEHLLGMDANNAQVPDVVEFEIKTTTGKNNPLSLFHKEPENGGQSIAGRMAKIFGWTPSKPEKYMPGTLSLRTTVKPAFNERGFRFAVGDEFVRVMFAPASVNPKHAAWLKDVRARHRDHISEELPAESVWMDWTRDELSRAVTAKMRNCVVVYGEKKGKIVRFNRFSLFYGFRISKFYESLKRGETVVEIGAWAAPNGKFRSHGTKFRVTKKMVESLYTNTDHR